MRYLTALSCDPSPSAASRSLASLIAMPAMVPIGLSHCTRRWLAETLGAALGWGAAGPGALQRIAGAAAAGDDSPAGRAWAAGCGLCLSRPARRLAQDAVSRRPAQRQPDRGGLRGRCCHLRTVPGMTRPGGGESSQIGMGKLRLKPQRVGREECRAKLSNDCPGNRMSQLQWERRVLTQLPLTGPRS